MTQLKLNKMWNTDSLWLEVAIVSIFFAVGNIFFGHFVEQSPRWHRLAKYLVTLALILLISIFLSRTVALLVLASSILPLIYIHGIVLPRKGINGWTGEPKSKYYDFRGWSKDIFNDKI